MLSDNQSQTLSQIKQCCTANKKIMSSFLCLHFMLIFLFFLLSNRWQKRMKTEFEPNIKIQYKIVCVDREDLCLTINKSVGKYLRPNLQAFIKNENQKFVISKSDMVGAWRIFGMANGKALCLQPIKSANGQYLKFMPTDFNQYENWYFDVPTEGFYANNPNLHCFKIRHESGLFLDLQNQKISTSNNLIIWSSTKSSTQLWKVIPV